MNDQIGAQVYISLEVLAHMTAPILALACRPAQMAYRIELADHMKIVLLLACMQVPAWKACKMFAAWLAYMIVEVSLLEVYTIV